MYDIIIRGGRIADGTGAPAYRADLAVKDGVIAAIGDLSGASAREILDADGLIVAPGFIDSHAHSDTSFLTDSSSASKIYQGITCEISGQCGDSPFPTAEYPSFDEFVRAYDAGERKMAVNQALLVGHGTLRAAVAGWDDRPVTDDELAQMQTLLRRDLASGAWGMSLGLEYAPGFFAGAGELQALGAVVREFDGLVPAHMRSEGLAIDSAIDELLDVGRASGVKVHISHLKVDNFRVHGRAAEIWQKITAAQAEGVRVSADMYPFVASCTGLTIRCPKWSKDGGDDALIALLTGPRRSEVAAGIREHYFNAERAETCLFSDDAGHWPEIVGKTLRQVAEDILHTTDYADAAADVIVRTHAEVYCIFFVMSEDDMLHFLRQDIGIGSDGYALSGDPTITTHRPHPRSFATMPEFFRRVREHDICPMEEAVRRVTSKAADMIGLTNRGRIAQGMAADITVFDPAAIAPRASYLDSVQLSSGVQHVIVNGQVALKNGAQTDVRCGRFLRKGV